MRNKSSFAPDQAPPIEKTLAAGGAAPNPALWSAALAAAGRCFAAARAGELPTGVRLHHGPDGRWHIRLHGLDHISDCYPESRKLWREIVITGALMRSAANAYEVDPAQEREVALIEKDIGEGECWAIAAVLEKRLRAKRTQAIIRAIASRLVVKLSMSGEELGALLAPIKGKPR
jgi:hypothetical protein